MTCQRLLKQAANKAGYFLLCVRALLDRARPRALNPARTSLTDLVWRAVSIARSQAVTAAARGHHVHVDFEPPTKDIELVADAAQIEDAVLNLVINAVEAIEGEGKVTVNIRSAESESEAEFDEEAVIEVSDTGSGISEEDLARIFHPFFTTTKGGDRPRYARSAPHRARSRRPRRGHVFIR
jgi:signal transduction histidine kinase